MRSLLERDDIGLTPRERAALRFAAGVSSRTAPLTIVREDGLSMLHGSVDVCELNAGAIVRSEGRVAFAVFEGLEVVR